MILKLFNINSLSVFYQNHYFFTSNLISVIIYQNDTALNLQ